MFQSIPLNFFERKVNEMKREALENYVDVKLRIRQNSGTVLTGLIMKLDEFSFEFKDKFNETSIISYEDISNITVIDNGETQ